MDRCLSLEVSTNVNATSKSCDIWQLKASVYGGHSVQKLIVL